MTKSEVVPKKIRPGRLATMHSVMLITNQYPKLFPVLSTIPFFSKHSLASSAGTSNNTSGAHRV